MVWMESSYLKASWLKLGFEYEQVVAVASSAAAEAVDFVVVDVLFVAGIRVHLARIEVGFGQGKKSG